MRTIRHLPAGEAAAQGARDHGHLRAARRAHGHAVDARRARGHRLPHPEPRGAQVDHPPLRDAAPRDRRGDPEDHRGHPRRADGRRRRGRGLRPREEALSRSGARWRRRRRASRGSPTSTASASSPARSATATSALGAVHQRWAAVPGRFKDYITPAEVERLPLDPHHRLGARRQAGRGADPHRRDARGRRDRGGGALVLQGRRALREPVRGRSLQVAAARSPSASRRRRTRGLPRARQARDVPGPGVLLHPQGRRGEAAARRHADRLRLRHPHPHRRLAASAPRSTASGCRSGPSSATASR